MTGNVIASAAASPRNSTDRKDWEGGIVTPSERLIGRNRERIARLTQIIKHLEGLGAERQAAQARSILARSEASLAAELDDLETQRRGAESGRDGD